MRELRMQFKYHAKQPERVYHEFSRGGERLSMKLLLTQAFLYQLNHFSILPFLFEYCQNLGHSPLTAGMLLAMTPLATASLSILQHVSPFSIPLKIQGIIGISFIILSNLLYLNASDLFLLGLSRFIFGYAGSKVLHRRYIANHVSQRFWTDYYQRLVYVNFLGMTLGPLLSMMIYLVDKEIRFTQMSPLYLIPGYIGLYISIPFLAVFVYRFVQPEI